MRRLKERGPEAMEPEKQKWKVDEKGNHKGLECQYMNHHP
jgi:hypothetical protein